MYRDPSTRQFDGFQKPHPPMMTSLPRGRVSLGPDSFASSAPKVNLYKRMQKDMCSLDCVLRLLIGRVSFEKTNNEILLTHLGYWRDDLRGCFS